MRQLIVMANWKMNGSISEAKHLIQSVIQGIKKDKQVAKVVICPPLPYLSLVQSMIASSSIFLGVQNVSQHISGAYTGEISAKMVEEFNVNFVIVGHSERRMLYGETNADVIEKIKAIQSQGLTPILCIGETLAEREAGGTKTKITQQIGVVIDALGIKCFTQLIIAYEPIWAIGTGVSATPEQAQEAHHFIRGLLAQHDSYIAQSTHILYGGSVNGSNAAQLFACGDIDGGLVGGASLKADDFLKICQG